MELEHSTVTPGNTGAQAPLQTPVTAEIAATKPGEYRVIRRNGKVTAFDADKIKVALTKAFLAVEGSNAAASTRIHEIVDRITELVVAAITRRMPAGGSIHIEDIQDQVELGLMRGEQHKVARSYVLYREERAREREAKAPAVRPLREHSGLNVTRADGSKVKLDEGRMLRLVTEACADIADTDPEGIIDETKRSLFDGVAEIDVSKALIMSARTFIEREPSYTYVAARLLLDTLRHEALSLVNKRERYATQEEMGDHYPEYFEAYVRQAIEFELMDARLGNFDLERLGQSPTSVCRHFTTATSCNTKGRASSCHRCSSCGSPWAWPSTRSIPKNGRLNSTICCRRSTS